MASPYARRGSGGGSPYAQRRPTPSPAPAGDGGHAHGVVGWTRHEIAKGGADLYHAAVNAPVGIYELVKTSEQAEQARVEYLLGTASKEEVQAKVKKANDLGDAVIAQTKQTISDPLRNPGNTFLLALPALTGAAKVAEAGAALRAGVPAAEVAKTLVTTAPPGVRKLRVNGATVEAPASRSALGRAAQKGIDKTLQVAAERKPGGAGSALLARRAGKQVTAAGKTREALWRAQAAALAQLGKKLTPGEQKALQVVAEQAPLSGRTAATLERVANSTGRERTGHLKELQLLRDAEPHLSDRYGLPSLVDDRLREVYRKMEQVAGGREALAERLGLLSEDAGLARKTKAGRVALAQPLADLEAGGQTSLLSPESAPLFQATEDAVRIPDVARRPLLGGPRRPVSGGLIDKQKPPPSFTHEYHGTLREQALRRQDTTRLVAESSAELARFAALEHVIEIAKQAATATPTRPSDLAIRLDGLKGGVPLEVRKYLDDPAGALAGRDPGEQAALLDKIRGKLIFDFGHNGKRGLSPDTAAEFAKLHAEGKIGFVPRGLLGEWAQAQAPLRAVIGSRPVSVWDGINNAQRLQILYLKVAYAVPNLLGNTALNLIQQGFASPVNLVRAARLNAKLGPELTARIDALVGEGAARAISAHGVGPLSAAVDKAAGVWAALVDRYPRRSAFLHEAHRAGYSTRAQMEHLLTSPGAEDELVRIAGEANREIIDYGAMSAREREIVRRGIFFYPWVRGSTVYAGRFLREHPVKAAALGTLSQQGQEWATRVLGKVPSYLEGMIPVGHGKVVNPAAVTIFGTPAQVGLGVAGLASGNIPQAAEAGAFLTPALNLALAEAFRRNYAQRYDYPGGTPAWKVALDALEANTPQVSLYNNIQQAQHGEGKGRLYPPSLWSSIAQFLFGGVYPRDVNQARLLELWLKEQQQMKRGGA